MSLAYFRAMWETEFRRLIRLKRWIGCDRDWRPAPYRSCGCHACALMRELGQEDRQ